MKDDKRIERLARKILGNYHPGGLTADNGGFKQDEPPPFSERVVVDTQKPCLYDADGRPIYRKVGF